MKRRNLLPCGLIGAALLVFAPASALGQPFDPEPFPPEPQESRVLKISGAGGSFLGVGLKELDAERAKALKLKEEAGVEITRVWEDSPASRAGLKVNDVVLQYNGQRVEGMEQFSRFVRETPPGRDVKLLISRDGQTQTLTAKIGERKGFTIPTISPRIEIPPMPDLPRPFIMWRSSVLGVEGESLRGQLADFFGAKEGVLVRSVMKDTPAEKAGIRAGDVIVKVNDVKVTSPGEVSAAIRKLKDKATVPVVLLRDKKELTVNATIEGDKSGWDGPGPAIRISGQPRTVRL
jgi:C-terminal processing protease CtpA/Prc